MILYDLKGYIRAPKYRMIRTYLKKLYSVIHKASWPKRPVFLVGIIILFGLLIRIDTLWLPHWTGDQAHSICLAMKLDYLGPEHYNLRGINVKTMGSKRHKGVALVAPFLDRDIESKGFMLSMLEGSGSKYYDLPLFHLPFGFPKLIAFSHSLFVGAKKPYISVYKNRLNFFDLVRTSELFKVQFYITVIPLMFFIGIVISTYYLGKLMFNERVGLYACFMLAINPVSIIASERIWADSMVCFFVSLSQVFITLFITRKKISFAFIAGVLCGIGALAKQTSGFLAVAYVIFAIVTHESWLMFAMFFLMFVTYTSLKRRLFVLYFVNNPLKIVIPSIIIYLRGKGEQWKTGIKSFISLLDRRIIVFSLGVALTAGFWFIKAYKSFGDPLFIPRIVDHSPGSKISMWTLALSERPYGPVLYLFGIPALMPLFALAFLSIKEFLSELWKALMKKDYDYRYILLWITILTFFSMLKHNKEHRLMLPVYPALAVLSSFYLERFREYSGRFSHLLGGRQSREIVILILLALCTLWSVPIGVRYAVLDIPIIPFPF